MLWPGLVSSERRMGIFHVAGWIIWMHAKLHMILIFSFALVTGPQSRLCGCVWVCAGVLLNVIHFMLVFTCLKRFMSVGTALEASADQVTNMNRPWLQSRPGSEV